jgi:hypothetical protein
MADDKRAPTPRPTTMMAGRAGALSFLKPPRINPPWWDKGRPDMPPYNEPVRAPVQAPARAGFVEAQPQRQQPPTPDNNSQPQAKPTKR